MLHVKKKKKDMTRTKIIGNTSPKLTQKEIGSSL
jgi:hypothetical protein